MTEPVQVIDLFSCETNIGLIAKDAGSANLIAHAFAHCHNTLVYCEEPGKTIFKGLGFTFASCANEVFGFADVLVIGTGGSDFEKVHLQSAHQEGKQTYSVLDHWINYEMRFEFGQATIEPNKILVFDSDAEDLARIKFPRTQVFFLVNKYEESIRSQVQNTAKENSVTTFLYIHENIAYQFESKEYWRACFERFYSQVSKLHNNFLIRLRIHPKDNPVNFVDFVSIYPSVVLSNSDLAVDIALSDVVVGVRSAALATARNCGKPVFTTNISPELRLPGPISRLPKFQHAYVL